MRIGVIGTGSMSDALGVQWASKGHEVLFGGRSPEKAAALAKKAGHGARAGLIADAAQFGEAVLLAVHHDAVPDALEAAGGGAGALSGKLVIDCNNPVDTTTFLPTTAPGTSMAEQIAETAKGTQVVKAFNMCQAKVWEMTPPAFDGRPLAVLYCGDDPAAKATAADLITVIGCKPIDVGPLYRARLLEPAANIVISLLFSGYDPHTVLNLVVSARDDKR